MRGVSFIIVNLLCFLSVSFAQWTSSPTSTISASQTSTPTPTSSQTPSNTVTPTFSPQRATASPWHMINRVIEIEKNDQSSYITANLSIPLPESWTYMTKLEGSFPDGDWTCKWILGDSGTDSSYVAAERLSNETHALQLLCASLSSSLQGYAYQVANSSLAYWKTAKVSTYEAELRMGALEAMMNKSSVAACSSARFRYVYAGSCESYLQKIADEMDGGFNQGRRLVGNLPSLEEKLYPDRTKLPNATYSQCAVRSPVLAGCFPTSIGMEITYSLAKDAYSGYGMAINNMAAWTQAAYSILSASDLSNWLYNELMGDLVKYSQSNPLLPSLRAATAAALANVTGMFDLFPPNAIKVVNVSTNNFSTVIYYPSASPYHAKKFGDSELSFTSGIVLVVILSVLFFAASIFVGYKIRNMMDKRRQERDAYLAQKVAFDASEAAYRKARPEAKMIVGLVTKKAVDVETNRKQSQKRVLKVLHEQRRPVKNIGSRAAAPRSRGSQFDDPLPVVDVNSGFESIRINEA